MKWKIAVARIAVSGTERVEIGNWLIEVALIGRSDPDISPLIDDIIHFPVSAVPTPCARQRAVFTARKHGCDLLFMVDDDCHPPEDFFKTAFLHLINHPPCVIATPYCSAGGVVQVFEFASPHDEAQKTFALEHIPREDAARRTGIQEVANIGTHLIAYNMKVFDAFENTYNTKVFYDYQYDPNHTVTIETEDTYCHRHLYFADIPIYVSWDHWAGHIKTREVVKPLIITKKDIEKVYRLEARMETK